ncbi:MAG: hypothetical protein WCK67_03340 [bacterium]
MKKLYNIDLRDDNLYKLFESRFLLLFTGLICGVAGVSFSAELGVNPFILFFGILIAIYIGFSGLKKSVTSPVFIYFVTQFIFIWLYMDEKILGHFNFSAKVNMLTLGIASFTTLFYFFNHFNYLWKNFPAFRYLTIFFAINIPYFFLYHSDFNLANYKTGYDLRLNSQYEGSNANFIVFLDSLCPLIGYTVGLMVFKNAKNYAQVVDTMKNIIDKTAKIFWIYYSIMIVTVLIGFNTPEFFANRLRIEFIGDYGPQIFLSLFLILFLAFKIYKDNFTNETIKLNFIKLVPLILINTILIFLLGNRTSLIALTASTSIFILYALKLGFKVQSINLNTRTRRFIKTAFELSMIIIPVLIAFYLIFATPEALTNKIDEFLNPATLDVRTSNWDLFTNEWIDRLNFNTALFGFGLGASRETIFFVSAMQGVGHLVQTVHNHIAEVVFDYGALSIFYFMSYLYIFLKSLMNIRRYPNLKIKLFSLVNVCLIIFFFIYHQTDGIKVTTGLIFFSMVGFMDSLIHGLLHNKEEYTKIK